MTYDEFIESVKSSRVNKSFEHSECHHIIPRCLGGSDDPSNLIYLTYKEHFIAHKLLCEKYPGHYGLAHAYLWMTSRGKNLTEEDYENARLATVGIPGPNAGKTFSDEVRLKMSLSHKGRIPRECVEAAIAHNTGRTRSEDVCKKISDNHADFKGENHPMYGKHHTEDSRKKMSESQLGNQNSKGKPKSDSVKKAVSESNRKRVWTEETRRKLSESQKRRWQTLKNNVE